LTPGVNLTNFFRNWVCFQSNYQGVCFSKAWHFANGVGETAMARGASFAAATRETRWAEGFAICSGE